MKYLLLANLSATLFMVSVIWFVQMVHYPLFARVGQEKFALYSGAHSRLTPYVVGPPMLVEFSNYYATVQDSARERACNKLEVLRA